MTLVELMMTLAVLGILLGLAVPRYNVFREKRAVVKAAEEIQNFASLPRSVAVKQNDRVGFDWWAANTGHGADFCLGISAPPKNVPCDCRETNAADADYCSVGASTATAVDGSAYRMTKADFIDVNDDFLHAYEIGGESHLVFEPVRGTLLTNNLPNSLGPRGQLFRIHSDLRWVNSQTYFALDIYYNMTGRITVCSDNTEPMLIGSFPSCNY